MLKNIENAGFRFFYAHENNTLLDRSKLVCTRDDLTQPKYVLNKTDVFESFSRESMNTKWAHNIITNLAVFAALLKDVPMRCKNAIYPSLCLKTTQSTLSCLKRIQESPITKTCAILMHLLSICMALKDWKNKLWNFSTYSSKHLTNLVPIISKVSIWTLVLLLRICYFSKLCCMMKILWKGTWSENLLDEVCRNTNILCD